MRGTTRHGAARDIASNAASGKPAAAFCGRIENVLVGRCFEGVGTILARLRTDTTAIRNECATLAGAHRASCLRGAGLTA